MGREGRAEGGEERRECGGRTHSGRGELEGAGSWVHVLHGESSKRSWVFRGLFCVVLCVVL